MRFPVKENLLAPQIRQSELTCVNQEKLGVVQLLDPKALNWGFWSEHSNNSKNGRINGGPFLLQ